MSTQSDSVERLQQRVAELERQLKQLRARLAQNAPVSVREALLVEAERVAHLGSWMWDLTTQEVYWSDEMFRILGRDPGRDQASAEGFFAAIHPDDLQRVREATTRSIANADAERLEFRVRTTAGGTRDIVMDGAFIFDEQGRIRRMVGGCLDVTRLRRSEREAEQGRALLELTDQISGVGVFLWERSEPQVRWSREMLEIFGTEQPLSRDDFLAMVVPEDSERVAVTYQELESEREAGPVAFQIRRRDGERRHLLMSGKTIGPNIVGGSVVDITHRIRLEQQLRQSQKMDAIGRLAGGIAHDFNNLLTAIIGNLELALVAPRETEPIEDALVAARHAADLTQQLLTFSRDAVIERRPLDLNRLVREATTLIRRVIGEDIRIQLDLAPDLFTVHADASQVNQVLMNLAVNARDALRGGGTLSVITRNASLETERCPPDAASTSFVELKVVDNGIGMDEATLAHVFDPFFTTKHQGKGTGLGLATVFGIVTQHHGTIEVESAPDAGTEFRIYLPSCDEPAPAIGVEPKRQPESFDRTSILVVEDNDQVRSIVQRFLETAGHRVVAAASAEAALETDLAEITLVVTDLVLPDLSGIELARQLRQRRPALNLLYMTGHAANTGGQMDGPVLQKPFTREQLLAKVGEASTR